MSESTVCTAPPITGPRAAATEEPVRCPTNPIAVDGTRHTIDGCGSTNVDGPDHEGLFDCLACGIWFSLEEARRG